MGTEGTPKMQKARVPVHFAIATRLRLREMLSLQTCWQLAECLGGQAVSS